MLSHLAAAASALRRMDLGDTASRQPAARGTAGTVEQLAKRVDRDPPVATTDLTQMDVTVQEMDGLLSYAKDVFQRLGLRDVVKILLQKVADMDQENIRIKLSSLASDNGVGEMDDEQVITVVRGAVRLITESEDASNATEIFAAIRDIETKEERAALVDAILLLTKGLSPDEGAAYVVLIALRKIALEKRQDVVEAFVPYLAQLDHGDQRAAVLETSLFLPPQEWKEAIPTFVALFRGVGEGDNESILYSLMKLSESGVLHFLNMALPYLHERSRDEKVGILQALSLFSTTELAAAALPLLITFFRGVSNVVESRFLCSEIEKVASDKRVQYLEEAVPRHHKLQTALLAYPTLDETKRNRVLHNMQWVPMEHTEAFFPIVVSIVDEMADDAACRDLIGSHPFSKPMDFSSRG